MPKELKTKPFPYHIIQPPRPPPQTSTSVQLDRIPRANPLAVLPKEKRHRRERQRDKRKQAVSPPDAELVVHWLSGQRQERAEQGTQDRGGCDGGSGVLCVSVDKVVLNWELCCVSDV